ncbi:MAG TPA: type II toxin-antitoxin system VapC family toxin [Dongiaceae bacterium]|nr:type II toxin-antitoxin system VapC family toxin [Dongiaceae bacterium]
MNRYLLDTNVVSELRKPKPHGAVVVWVSGLKDEQICVSAVTFGELQTGIEITRRQNPSKAQEIGRWVDRLQATMQVLAMDAACFREWGRLMHGQSDHLVEDAMIAATARLHGLVVATRNERDFRQLGVPVVNPFKTRGEEP